MKLINYAAAYSALELLAQIELPYETAYAVAKLKRQISPKAEYFQREELRIARKYGKLLPDGRLDIKGSRLCMKGDTDAEIAANIESYTKERDALCNIEDNDIENAVIEKPVISIPPEVKIKPFIIEALDGFCVFGQV